MLGRPVLHGTEKKTEADDEAKSVGIYLLEHSRFGGGSSLAFSKRHIDGTSALEGESHRRLDRAAGKTRPSRATTFSGETREREARSWKTRRSSDSSETASETTGAR